MTLATATIERFATITSNMRTVTETPVRRNPDIAEAGTRTMHMIYVTDVEEPIMRGLIGTVVQAIPSPSQNGWLHREADGASILRRVYGAVLNDDMVNGHHYRTLDNTGMLVRFNDAGHAGDRHLPGSPLSILAVHGAPWPIPNDGTTFADDVPYIEVQAPAGADSSGGWPAGILADSEVEVEIPMDVHQFVEDTSVNGPTRGFGKADDQGRVRLNPEPEVGGFYLEWSTGRAWSVDRYTVVKRCTSVGGEDGPEFRSLGYFRMTRGEPVFVGDSDSAVLMAGDVRATAEMALSTTPVSREDASAFVAKRNTEGYAFTEFNEAVNQLAKDNDWCSEYEGIIEPLGMEGRTKELNDYTITLSVDFSFEDDSPSGRVDEFAASHYDAPNMSLSSARYTGTATVSVRVEEQEDGESAENQIDSEMVEDALSSQLSYASDIEVTDWEVRSTEAD